jgi:hypothetical protein
MEADKVSRSYLAIRREAGKPDYSTNFPVTASSVDMVGWCESEGYTVIDTERIDTPDDPTVIAKIIVTVKPKHKTGK